MLSSCTFLFSIIVSGKQTNFNFLKMKNLIKEITIVVFLLCFFQFTVQAQPLGSKIKIATNGQISYWNGSGWTDITVIGSPGQTLDFSGGIPNWIVNPQGITTVIASAIASNSAISGGNVVSDGGAIITERGVCWNTSPNPTKLNFKTTNGTGIGSFSSNLTALLPGTTYYYRSYASNGSKTSYGNELSFTTTAAPITTVGDIDGNIYDIVVIGTQTWMKQNLNTSKFRNGDLIGSTTDNYYWSAQTSSQYCDYNNLTANSDIYGKLYNYFVVNDPRHICPLGWHVPSIAEWNTLSNYAGGETVAGKKLKETGISHWSAPNASATDEFGFTALPGGYRSETGAYWSINGYSCFWSGTESNTNTAWAWSLSYYENSVTTASHYEKRQGKSIRCIAD